MKSSVKRGLFIGIAAIVVIPQFIPIQRENPASDPSKDFLTTIQIDPQSAALLKSACYDCHSHQTKYPWYSYIAPPKFILANHISEGREELNFSTWTDYDAKKKDHKLEEVMEALKEGWMPTKDYVFMHPEADLTVEQRANLAEVIGNIRANAKAKATSAVGQPEISEKEEEGEE